MPLATITQLEPFNINSSATFTFASTSVTANVAAGNIKTDNLLYANGVAWSFGSSTYSNSDVALYLPTYTGNFTAGNVSVTGSITTNGNISGVNYVNANYFSGDGSLLDNIAAGNIDGQVSNSLVAGTVYTNAQPNITSVGILTDITVEGDASLGNTATANFFIGNGSLLTGLPASYSNSNVATYLPTYTGNFTAGNVSVTGSITTGTLTTSGASGNISGVNYVIANYFSGNGSLLTGLPASYANSNVATYLPTYNGNISPGNLVVGTRANLGAVGNIVITGGSSGQVLSTNGSGSLSWVDQGGPTGTTVTVDVFTASGSATDFTLSTTPEDETYTLVNINGTSQLKSSYTVSGTTLTFSEAPPAGVLIEVTTLAAATSGGSSTGPGYTYEEVTTSATLTSGKRYLLDTSSTALTLTLPASPTLGDEIGIIDGTGNANTNNITIARNGQNIQGLSQNMTVNTSRSAFVLVYYNASQGWLLTQV